VVAEHGADVLRLYELFMGDFELPKPWDPARHRGPEPVPAARVALVESGNAPRR
jgi:hypothetical protein